MILADDIRPATIGDTKEYSKDAFKLYIINKFRINLKFKLKKREQSIMPNSVETMQAPKIKKFPVSLITLLVLSLIGSIIMYNIHHVFIYLLAYYWFGLIFGLFLQYGHFCMSSAIRDLFAIRVARVAAGLMIALMIYAIVSAVSTGFGFLTFSPNSFAVTALIGGAIFGFGIVFAGGCSSGSLYKSGEGNMVSWIVLFNLGLSQIVFAETSFGFLNYFIPKAWKAAAAQQGIPKQYLHSWYDYFMTGYIFTHRGYTMDDFVNFHNIWANAFISDALIEVIIPCTIVLVIIYRIYHRKHYISESKLEPKKIGFKNELKGIWSMIVQAKRTVYGGLGLGVFAGLNMFVLSYLRRVYHFINFGQILDKLGYTHGIALQGVFDPGYWYIATQEAQALAWVFEKLGWNLMNNVTFGFQNGIPNPLLNPPLLMSFGTIIGAAVMALSFKEFSWKIPNLEAIIFAVFGGWFMGIGVRIGLGCNIGSFFVPVANGDPSGWVYFVGMIIGSYFAVKAISKWINYKSAKDLKELDNIEGFM